MAQSLMNNKSTLTLCGIIAVILVVALVIYFCSKRSNKTTQEGFGNFTLNDMNAQATGTYSTATDADIGSPTYLDNSVVPFASVDTPCGSENVSFGDMISGCNASPYMVPESEKQDINPFDNLKQTARSQMPQCSKNITPYSLDVADPTTFNFAVGAPRVQLKDRQWQTSDPFRGDIVINYSPETCLISRSRYGRDSLRLDGYFSDTYKALYNKYSGNRSYCNQPLYVSNQETIMDAY